MNRMIKAAVAAAAVAAAGTSVGCHSTGAGGGGAGGCGADGAHGGGATCQDRLAGLWDPCWPERYSYQARQATLQPFAAHASNGAIVDQTLSNYHFEGRARTSSCRAGTRSSTTWPGSGRPRTR
jgi:hypothetical protein